MGSIRRVVIIIYFINTFRHLLAAGDEYVTLQLHFIYLVMNNESILQKDDIALIESSRTYKIEEIIQSEKRHHESFVISEVSSLPSDRIYDDGEYINCFKGATLENTLCSINNLMILICNTYQLQTLRILCTDGHFYQLFCC
jgi:hypothetical protein